MDPSVRMGGDSGKPVVLSQPDSAVAKAFRQITEQIAARISVAAVKQNNNIIPINMIG
jgi:ATP-binding protein involved in chromosome partitioning